MAITGTRRLRADTTSAVVYRAIAPNGKSYIGISSKSLEYRQAVHKKDALNNYTNSLFHKAIRKYGFENIQWEVLEKVDSWQVAQERERFYIEKLDTYKNGYNMTPGGEGGAGFKHTEEAKIKMSTIKSGKPVHPNSQLALDNVRKIKHPRLGAKVSDETRQKISKATIGRPCSALAIERSKEKTEKEVCCYNIEGDLIQAFTSITNAYYWLNKTKISGGIVACCKGKRKTAYGYVWKYKEDNICR